MENNKRRHGRRVQQFTVQCKFLRSIETGPLSDSVKFHILPHLSDVSMTDEELIERVNEAAKVENERQEKWKRCTVVKSPKVQELQTEIQTDTAPTQGAFKPKESNTTVTVKTVKGKETKPDNMNTQQIMEELRTEIKQMFQTVRETSLRPPGLKQRLGGCRKCREERVGENCSQCFNCGQEGHLSRGCRTQRPWSGNGCGLQGRDHQ